MQPLVPLVFHPYVPLHLEDILVYVCAWVDVTGGVYRCHQCSAALHMNWMFQRACKHCVLCSLPVYVTCDILVDSHCLDCKSHTLYKHSKPVLKMILCSVNPLE